MIRFPGRSPCLDGESCERGVALGTKPTPRTLRIIGASFGPSTLRRSGDAADDAATLCGVSDRIVARGRRGQARRTYRDDERPRRRGPLHDVQHRSHRGELDNMLAQASVSLRSAMGRTESRGAHAREDFPKRDDGSSVSGTRPCRAAMIRSRWRSRRRARLKFLGFLLRGFARVYAVSNHLCGPDPSSGEFGVVPGNDKNPRRQPGVLLWLRHEVISL